MRNYLVQRKPTMHLPLFPFRPSMHIAEAALVAGLLLSAGDATAQGGSGIAFGAAQPTVVRQFYTEWTFDAANQRYLALYLFRPNANDFTFKAQMVVYHPVQAGKVYYYN